MTTYWGIISAGKISNDFTLALKTLPSNEHAVIGVAARTKKSAEEFASKHNIPCAYGSYEELLKNPKIEVVYIGVIHPEHFKVAKLSLEHGKSVLCEKPLCMNHKEAQELIQLAKEKNLFLMEAVWSRCFPVYEILRDVLAKNSIGDVLHLDVTFGAVLHDIDRIWKKELGGGTVLDLGIYTLQLATLVFKGNPSSVLAAGHLNAEGVDEDMGCVLTYPSGGTAMLSTHSKVQLPNEATITGTKGFVKIFVPFWAPTKITVSSHCQTQEKEFPLPENKSLLKFNFPNGIGMHYEAVEVRRCLVEGLKESPLMTHEDSLRLAKLEDEIRKQLGVQYPQDN